MEPAPADMLKRKVSGETFRGSGPGNRHAFEANWFAPRASRSPAPPSLPPLIDVPPG